MPTATGAKSASGAAKSTASRSTKAKAKSTVDKVVEVSAETSRPSVVEVDADVASKVDNVNAEKLNDTDEIEVVALIPNVSYYDKATGDRYEWEYAGDVEYMTVDAIQRMRRNSRGYFEDMCLKPNDARVIKKFGMERYYSQHDYLMDASNYTKDNIAHVLDEFSAIRSNSLKASIVSKIKDMIASGELSDVVVIRTIEKRLDIDLISLL